MKIALVAGARPNFVKIAPLLEALKARPGLEPFVVHTGQHYDDAMSAGFFRDLEMPEPDRNLGVGSGSHAAQTARIMERFDALLDEDGPVDLVAVVGDVNSTVACTLTAVKRRIPVAHVEAGLRSFDRRMPEEINRIVTDALSSYLFTPSRDADENLLEEGRPPESIHFVGNVMVDTLLRFREKARERSRTFEALGLARGAFALLTLHRPENVDDPCVFGGILRAVGEIQRDVRVVYPVHPRSRKTMDAGGFLETAAGFAGLTLTEPLGYLDFTALESDALFVMTDSGGVQEETTVLGVPCLTLRENTERPVTVTEGTNTVVGLEPDAIVAAARAILSGTADRTPRRPELWDGKAAGRIVTVLASAACRT
jgi:UDP-N-acetylglucosamine 2-epimerase (non-hydrolysing)